MTLWDWRRGQNTPTKWGCETRNLINQKYLHLKKRLTQPNYIKQTKFPKPTWNHKQNNHEKAWTKQNKANNQP